MFFKIKDSPCDDWNTLKFMIWTYFEKSVFWTTVNTTILISLSCRCYGDRTWVTILIPDLQEVTVMRWLRSFECQTLNLNTGQLTLWRFYLYQLWHRHTHTHTHTHKHTHSALSVRKHSVCYVDGTKQRVSIDETQTDSYSRIRQRSISVFNQVHVPTLCVDAEFLPSDRQKVVT